MSVLNFKTAEERQIDINNQMNLEFLEDKLNLIQLSSKHSFGLFKGCHSLTGPLHYHEQQMMLRYHNSPIELHWDSIANLPITPNAILLDAWMIMDSNIGDWIDEARDLFVENKIHWKSLPNPTDLIKGVEMILGTYQKEIENKILSLKK